MRALRSHVREHRDRLGISQTELATRVGISRQSVAAIEAGRSVPSTAIALRLSAVLAVSVENLFALLADGLDSAAEGLAPGTRVALGRVGGRWVGHALPGHDTTAADALVTPDGRLELLVDPSGLETTALVTGCAPILGALCSPLRGPVDGRSRWLLRPSGASLEALATGRTHIAGLHLAAHDAPGAHDALVREALPGEDLEIVSLVGWREGLAVAPGNPRGVRGPTDLGRPGLRIALRSPGAGATLVLERAATAAGIAPRSLCGPTVDGHAHAALAVLHGAADAAVMVEPIAAAHGLPFLPLSEERFELVLRARDRAHAGVARFLARLQEASAVREIRAMGAYNTTETGSLRRVGAA